MPSWPTVETRADVATTLAPSACSYQLLPPSTPPLPKTPVARHVPHAVPFRQTYNKIPEAAEYDSLRIHPADAARSSKGGAGASRTAVPARRGAKWHWKDAREELGCLLHYVTSSEAAALPDLNTDEPLDPGTSLRLQLSRSLERLRERERELMTLFSPSAELILDFNPYSPASGSRSGRRMVEQTVDDFWNGKSTLGGGKVVIVGKDSDPCVRWQLPAVSRQRLMTCPFFCCAQPTGPR